MLEYQGTAEYECYRYENASHGVMEMDGAGARLRQLIMSFMD
jgi:hypothetical protein